jgi:hypothetical protein
MPPITASSVLSITICETMRERDAPSEARIANSWLRLAKRPR